MGSVNKRVILIALILALFSSFLIYVYIKKATTAPDMTEYADVFVAARTMPSKHMITEADIKTVKVSRNYIHPKAILNKGDIVGKASIDSIIEGEQILSDRLVDGNNSALAFNIPEGKRAVSINVNEQTQVANLIMPGDFVDVIVSFNKEDISPAITKTVIQNIEVLALGQQQIISDKKPAELPKTVTLAVSLQEAEKLVYASEFGVLRLALRRVNDKSITNTTGAVKVNLVP